MMLGACSLLLCLALTSCAQSPTDVALSVETTACGHASSTSGAGVIVGDDLALVSAHVVIGATDVTVLVGGKQLPAQIIKLDTQSDLAVLSVANLGGEPIMLGRAKVGDTVRIIGGGPTPPLEVTVSRVVEVRIEEVRSSVRSSRTGYEIEHRVQLGDSGAGVLDSRGNLVGLVFGRIKEAQERSFVVDSEEISKILASTPDLTYRCDPVESRVIAS